MSPDDIQFKGEGKEKVDSTKAGLNLFTWFARATRRFVIRQKHFSWSQLFVILATSALIGVVLGHGDILSIQRGRTSGQFIGVRHLMGQNVQEKGPQQYPKPNTKHEKLKRKIEEEKIQYHKDIE